MADHPVGCGVGDGNLVAGIKDMAITSGRGGQTGRTRTPGGKGDLPRKTDRQKYGENYDRIFGEEDEGEVQPAEIQQEPDTETPMRELLRRRKTAW